jgi:hypothetical protein
MEFYASMIVPLYMRCYDVNDSTVPQQIYESMQKYGAFKSSEQQEFNGVPARYWGPFLKHWEFGRDLLILTA